MGKAWPVGSNGSLRDEREAGRRKRRRRRIRRRRIGGQGSTCPIRGRKPMSWTSLGQCKGWGEKSLEKNTDSEGAWMAADTLVG